MSKEEVRIIETIVRQGWLDSADPAMARFGSWLDVDQDQALALIELIPYRLGVYPQRLALEGPTVARGPCS